MRRKKKAAAHMKAVAQAFDEGAHVSQMCSPDEEERGGAVRSLCPCHVGWEVFESHVGEVLGALKDRSREVRAQALHVLEDAARMRQVGELDYYLQAAEERLRGNRASRFRPGESVRGGRKMDRLRWGARRLVRAKG